MQHNLLILVFLFYKQLVISVDIRINRDKSCVVCLSSLNEHELLFKYCQNQCNSYYHEKCWFDCMEYDIRCPVCRVVQTRLYSSNINRDIESNINASIPPVMIIRINGQNDNVMNRREKKMLVFAYFIMFISMIALYFLPVSH